MSEIEISKIENNYRNMSDKEIIRIATTDMHGMRPEVMGIIEKEIKSRRLSLKYLSAAKAQNDLESFYEIDKYCDLIRTLPCPLCGQSKFKLNAAIIHRCIHILIISAHNSKIIVACPLCIVKEIDRANAYTITLGFLGPHGFISTPFTLLKNNKEKKNIMLNLPSETFMSFILSNIGQIEMDKDDNYNLLNLLKSSNTSYKEDKLEKIINKYIKY